MTIAARLTPFLENKEARDRREAMFIWHGGYGLANAASQSRIKFDPYIARPKGGLFGGIFSGLF